MAESLIVYEVVEDRRYIDTWRVQAIGDDGEIYVVIFTGVDSKSRAEEYAAWKKDAEPFPFQTWIKTIALCLAATAFLNAIAHALGWL